MSSTAFGSAASASNEPSSGTRILSNVIGSSLAGGVCRGQILCSVRAGTGPLDSWLPRLSVDLTVSRAVAVLDRRRLSADSRAHRATHLASDIRSEEHTSELQSPYVISYAVFC